MFLMLQCFYENGNGWKNLALSKSVAESLMPGDLVLNLNYDTVFELALLQANRPFAYSPNVPSTDQVLVCKPHGSLNMVSTADRFKFGQPEWLGTPQPRGFQSYSGLIPPRLNKSYSQHWIAQMILTPVAERQPERITMPHSMSGISRQSPSGSVTVPDHVPGALPNKAIELTAPRAAAHSQR
ncbi:MAG: hypothetical protein DMD94_27025 [Candidatus Rokuibacteriota bacterium]|nr:MAG: hypothetical protein DMD94_27025 [Candidatus Rokubacteria bacterium]